MHIAIKDLSLDHLWIIYPGEHEYPVEDKITAMPIEMVDLMMLAD